MKLPRRAEFRHCLMSTTDVQVTRKEDGSWSVEGLGGEEILSVIESIQEVQHHFNLTFFVSLDPNECVQRMTNNLSDGSNYLMPIGTLSPYYRAIQPMFPGKVQFLTGYKESEHPVHLEETVSVFHNIKSLQPEVYEFSALLFLIFVLFLMIRLKMFHKYQFRKNNILKKITFINLVRRELSSLFYGKNDHFKLLSFLYAVLIFYLITSLMCVYKTSQVIAKKADYPTCYQDSIDSPTSLIFLYDQFVVVSSDFRDAPRFSLKGQLWAKLDASGKKDEFKIDGTTVNFVALPALMRKIAIEISERKSIAVSSSITIPLLKAIACGLSPEGQLWFLKILSDPSEPEQVYAFAFTTAFKYIQVAEKSIQRALETYVIPHHFESSFDITDQVSRIAGTTRQHQWRQHLACTDENALRPDTDVHPIPIHFYLSFTQACLLVWIVAVLALVIEIVSSRRNNTTSHSRVRVVY